MADALRHDRIQVEQTLHGYSEGHRLIAGSVKLPQQDARTMLLLSDASGSSARIPVDGYLTGYPLSGAGKYVLARTWSAPEISRPGCVWTHSLLVDFADLARLMTADDLGKCFMRPSNGGTSEFASALDIQSKRSPATVAERNLPRVAHWIAAIYGKPRSRIVAERDGADDDALVLAMWMQQWPRLRRSFRFCTQVVDDRSTGAEVFDLQLIDGLRSSHRSRIPNAVFASDLDGSYRIDLLLEDLRNPGHTTLRSFLRDVGGDVSNGRAAMLPLVRLFEALEPGSNADEIADMVAELEALGPNQGRVARAAIAKLVFSRPDVVDDDLFSFALDQVQSVPDLLGVDPVLVGRGLLRWRPQMFGVALSNDGPLRTAAEAVLPTIRVGDLASAFSALPEALITLLVARPDFLKSPVVWSMRSLDVSKLFATVDLDADQTVGVVSAMIAANRDDCADAFVGRYGVRPVVRALSKRGSSGFAPSWLRAIASRTDELAACMSDETLYERAVLIALSHVLDPDDVPNSIGPDPWVTAIHHSQASTDTAGEDMLAAFLFCRAMGRRSRSPGRLFFLSVQRLHEASAANRLHGAARYTAERRLPWVSPWREWDRCERIRRAVVDQFLDRELPPLEFGTVVADGRLWSGLVDIASDSSRGRRYLDRVRRGLRDGPDDWWHLRAQTIDMKIR